MFGFIVWSLWSIGFALVAMNMLLRLFAVLPSSLNFSFSRVSLLATGVYALVAIIGAGLGVSRLLTADSDSFASLNYILLSLIGLVFVALALVILVRDWHRLTRWIWSARMSVLWRSARYEEVVSAAERMLARRPKFAGAWYIKAQALISLDQPAEALDAFEHSLTLLPNSRRTQPTQQAMVVTARAFALFALHRDTEALTACDEALVLAADYTAAWAYKAAILQRMGREEEAVVALMHVLDDTRHWTNSAIRGMAFGTMATALNALGRHQEALDVAKRGVELHPYPVRSLLAQAVALAGLGHTEEALTAAEKGLEVTKHLVIARPRNIDAWEMQAAFQRWLGNISAAEDAEARAQALLT